MTRHLTDAGTLERSSLPVAGEAVASLLHGYASPIGSTLLELRRISLSFGGVKALTDIDLDVVQGEIRAIIGPNGAGKSSLLNVISGIYAPDNGTISFAGRTYSSIRANRVAKLGFARTYQNLALFKGLTVLQNIQAGFAARVRSTFIEQAFAVGRARSEEKAARQAAEQIIEVLDLGAYRNRSAAGLSYGLQKRVELARALVTHPKLLLLDEPMAGIAAAEKLEFADYIRSARDSFGTTVVLIEHDIGVVMGLSDRIAVLDYGRKIADGTPADVQSDQAVIDAYLGIPHDATREGAEA